MISPRSKLILSQIILSDTAQMQEHIYLLESRYSNARLNSLGLWRHNTARCKCSGRHPLPFLQTRMRSQDLSPKEPQGCPEWLIKLSYFGSFSSSYTKEKEVADLQWR